MRRTEAADRRRWSPRMVALLALTPAMCILGVFFYGFIFWTAAISLTSSRLLPRYDFVGLRNYDTLFGDERFGRAMAHLFLFGGLFVSTAMLLGLTLAIGIDRLGARASSLLRLIYLFPLSISWLVTGLLWQWILNPGPAGFGFDVLVRQDTALYALAGAGVWHISGLVMALFLAGLRNVDPDIWRAARVEAIPVFRVYLHVILPMLRPYAVTALLLLSFGVVRMFDLVVAMTGGGPGFATDMPALYIYDYTFTRSRVAIGAASATILTLTMIVALAPYLAIELRRRR